MVLIELLGSTWVPEIRNGSWKCRNGNAWFVKFLTMERLIRWVHQKVISHRDLAVWAAPGHGECFVGFIALVFFNKSPVSRRARIFATRLKNQARRTGNSAGDQIPTTAGPQGPGPSMVKRQMSFEDVLLRSSTYIYMCIDVYSIYT